ncbi:MAG: ubiquitin carboxyl-terminal hydrolase [Amoebophilaceae bacterium]|nr:ubiquitin carboxyl-terminal hydrolase [Amoebophilaceae bacterium]
MQYPFVKRLDKNANRFSFSYKNSIDRLYLFIFILGCMSLFVGCNFTKTKDHEPELPQVDLGTKMPFNGISNVVNTCYMNASLQVIAACYADKVQEGSPLKKLIDSINDANHGVVTIAEVQEFRKSLIGKFNNSHNQEDAHEFLMACNDQYPFLEGFNRTDQCIIANNGKYYIKDRTPAAENMFSLCFPNHKNESQSCSHKLADLIDSDQLSFKLEENLLNIELKEYNALDEHAAKHPSINNLLLQLNPMEEQQGQNKVTNYLLGSYIAKLPDKLCIHMKRSKQDENNNIPIKVKDRILGAKNIKLREGASFKETRNVFFQVHFGLCGFILHHGDSLHSGHYTACIKKNNQWYSADDTTVRAIDEAEALKQSEAAYLLFYTKKQNKFS